MRRKLHTWCILLTAILLLTALGGCGEVDNGLLKKTVAAVEELTKQESGGFRQDTYLGDMEVPVHTSETWFRSNGDTVDWYMLSSTYVKDGQLWTENAVAQRDGVIYMRHSTPDKEGTWKKPDGAVPSDKIGFPSIDCLDKGEDYEFFRKETDGSIKFSYSPTGLAAFGAQLVTLVKDGIPTEFDESQYTEEELAAVKKQYACIVASAEQTKVMTFSGAVMLDEEGVLLRHEMQYGTETPELEPDENGGWTAADTKTAEMKFVTEILARSDAEAEQKLAELFAELPGQK